MEKEVRAIVITKRFRRNTFSLYNYLLTHFSAKTANLFLNNLQQRIELISQNPEIGKPSLQNQQIRSVILTPHNRIFYRLQKNKIEILCLFDMRKNPKKKPY